MPDFDAFRRRVQAGLFAGLPAHVSRLRWDAEQIAAVQRCRLRTLLALAISRSPFHARRLAGLDPAAVELADLRTLPVMTKDDLMDEWDQVVTDPRLTLRAAEESLAATGAEPRLLSGGYACLATGGSSGRRGVFVADASALTEFFSLILRPSAARRSAAGAAQSGRLTIAFVAAASAVHATGLAPQIMAGSPVTFIPVPVTLPLAEIVARLNGHVQPLIRYEIGDCCTRQPDSPGHGHLRAAVEGRSDEILRYPTADVHPLVLRSVVLASPEVTDYQVRQTPSGVAVAVQSDRLADPDALRRRLRSALARAGLRDPDVSVRPVPALPRDPETGKLRRFIPA